MATSSSYVFDPTFASLLDEAFERAGLAPQSITQRHIISAKMSLNLMFSEWAVTDGDPLFRVKAGTATVLSGTNYFDLPAGHFDIEDLVLEYNDSDVDVSMARTSRQDYLLRPDKTATGQPSLYYVDRAITLNTPRVILWPVPDATCLFTYDALRRHQTVTAMTETLDVENAWLEAAVAGLAERIAEKYNTSRLQILIPRAQRAYAIAKRAGSGNSQIVISGRGFGRARTRRR